MADQNLVDLVTAVEAATPDELRNTVYTLAGSLDAGYERSLPPTRPGSRTVVDLLRKFTTYETRIN